MKLVCLGDSLTRGYKIKQTQAWPSLLSQQLNVQVLNMGINGDTTGGMLARFYNDVVNEKPTHAIIMGGGNDLIWGVPLSVIKANLFAMVQQANHHFIIPIIGIPIPFAIEKAKIHWPFVDNYDLVNENLSIYRNWILELTKNFGLNFLDFYQCFINNQNNIKDDNYIDGVHPTVKGNLIMSNLVTSSTFGNSRFAKTMIY